MKKFNLTIAIGTMTAILSASALGLAAETVTAKATGIATPTQELVVDRRISRSEARKLVKAYLKERGKKLRKWQRQAEKALARRELNRAGALCRQILEVQPDHAHALYLLGTTAQMSGRHGEARERFLGLPLPFAQLFLDCLDGVLARSALATRIAAAKRAVQLIRMAGPRAGRYPGPGG